MCTICTTIVDNSEKLNGLFDSNRMTLLLVVGVVLGHNDSRRSKEKLFRESLPEGHCDNFAMQPT
jgi:hypothetical protein